MVFTEPDLLGLRCDGFKLLARHVLPIVCRAGAARWSQVTGQMTQPQTQVQNCQRFVAVYELTECVVDGCDIDKLLLWLLFWAGAIL